MTKEELNNLEVGDIVVNTQPFENYLVGTEFWIKYLSPSLYIISKYDDGEDRYHIDADDFTKRFKLVKKIKFIKESKGSIERALEPAKVKKFRKIVNDMADLYAKKNKDYGDSFNDSLDKFGLIASVVRISDKFNRLVSLVKNNNPEIKNETIEDTLIDGASYMIMTLMWIKKRKNEI